MSLLIGGPLSVEGKKKESLLIFLLFLLCLLLFFSGFAGFLFRVFLGVPGFGHSLLLDELCHRQ